MSTLYFIANIAIICSLSNLSYILFWATSCAAYNVVYEFMFHSKIFEYMDSKKLKKRKKQASKPKRMSIFEELNRPVTYILDDVKETIVTENTYKAIPYNVLKTYFLPKGWF